MAAADATGPRVQVTDGLPKPRRYFAILALSAGTALAVIDGGIANVALPTIARDLRISANDAVLIVTVYQLVLVMTLLPFSALGDRIGHRKLYQGGQMVFILATLLCFFAHSLHVLVAARAMQAVGAGAALSVSAALVRATYPARQLGRGMGISTIIITSAAAVAPTLGGAILAVAPWQWVFAIAIPFAVISLLVGRKALPKPRQYTSEYHLKGALLSAATFGLTIVGLEGLAHGQSIWLSLVEICAGAIAGYLFVKDQAAVERPIMPFELLKQRLFALSVLGAFLAFIAQMCLMVSLPFRLQHGFGFSPVEVGAVLAPWPLTLMIVAPAAGVLSDRVPAGLLGGIGMAIGALALLTMAFLPPHPSHFDIGWRMALCGLGFGLFLSPNARLIIGSAPRDRAASAGGMVATVRLCGQTLGASLVAGLLAAGLGDGAIPALIGMGLAVFAGLFSVARLWHKPVKPNAASDFGDY